MKHCCGQLRAVVRIGLIWISSLSVWAVRMLMMNAFDPLLKAAGMSPEHIKALLDQIQKTKLTQRKNSSQSARRAEPETRRPTE